MAYVEYVRKTLEPYGITHVRTIGEHYLMVEHGNLSIMIDMMILYELNTLGIVSHIRSRFREYGVEIDKGSRVTKKLKKKNYQYRIPPSYVSREEEIQRKKRKIRKILTTKYGLIVG